MSVFVIGFGGFLGAIARFYVSKVFSTETPHAFPAGTLLVNVVGCLFMGIMMYFVVKNNFAKSGMMLFLTVGFLASFTTFSSFGFETMHLLQAGKVKFAFLNVFYNVVFGLLAVAAGYSFFKYVIKP